MSSFQEQLWRGPFGREYSERNDTLSILAHKQAFWSRVLASVPPIDSICELGANVGLNVRAIKTLLPECELTAVEINDYAFTRLRNEDCIAVHSAINAFDPRDLSFDLVYTCGVLIHVDPDDLPSVYRLMARASRRFVLISEYYSQEPVSVAYRGVSNALFKRDFAGEFLHAHPDFVLRDYGFVYHLDDWGDGEDVNWFLLERDVRDAARLGVGGDLRQ